MVSSMAVNQRGGHMSKFEKYLVEGTPNALKTVNRAYKWAEKYENSGAATGRNSGHHPEDERLLQEADELINALVNIIESYS
jgi:hypothetical protein